MTLTLLLDLDGTLLTNSVKTFVPAYMAALAQHLAPEIQADQLGEAVLISTRQMIQNMDPNCLLADVFDSNFYPRIGKSRQELEPAISEFFAKVYPSLKSLTDYRAEAVRVVQDAFKRDYRLVIATNPLFPLTAIEQRLDWAGLSPRDFPFAFVPGVENVHFAKPNPAFLAELLARLGWPKDPAIMVGDDLESDIQCAQALGLPTYYLGSQPDDGQQWHHPYGSGSLGGLFEWIDQIPREQLNPQISSPAGLLAVLRSTPAALNSLRLQIDPAVWTQRPQPDEWSPAEIFCHLRDVEGEVNLPRLVKVISENNPFIPGLDTDAWAEERRYIEQNGELALNSFITSRVQVIEMLSRLDNDAWQRPARHAIFGPTKLQELVSIIAGHDRLHIRQLHSMIYPGEAVEAELG